MLLVIDNYDSFVYNLARYLAELGCPAEVVRNDRVTVREVAARKPAAIIISPGPCTPHEAGISVDVVRELSESIPILGVCLGHQAIGAAYDAKIVRAPRPVHGMTSSIRHAGDGLFADLPNPLRVARYHSLIVDEQTLPPDLVVTARSADGLPMALAHRTQPLYGVQFHPESVLTEAGHRLLANFLTLAGLSPKTIGSGDLLGAVDDLPLPPEAPVWFSGNASSKSPIHW